MQDEQLKHADAHTERRPAVWPWLLIPLVTLALFFGLRKVQHATMERAGAETATPSHPAPEPNAP